MQRPVTCLEIVIIKPPCPAPCKVQASHCPTCRADKTLRTTIVKRPIPAKISSALFAFFMTGLIAQAPLLAVVARPHQGQSVPHLGRIDEGRLPAVAVGRVVFAAEVRIMAGQDRKVSASARSALVEPKPSVPASRISRPLVRRKLRPSVISATWPSPLLSRCARRARRRCCDGSDAQAERYRVTGLGDGYDYMIYRRHGCRADAVARAGAVQRKRKDHRRRKPLRHVRTFCLAEKHQSPSLAAL